MWHRNTIEAFLQRPEVAARVSPFQKLEIGMRMDKVTNDEGCFVAEQLEEVMGDRDLALSLVEIWNEGKLLSSVSA